MIAELSITVAIAFLIAGLRKYWKLHNRFGFVRFVLFVGISPCIAFTPRLITMAYSYGWLPTLWLAEINTINSLLHAVAMIFFYLGGRGWHKALDQVLLFRPSAKQPKES